MTDRHDKWVPVEPGTVIPAGQPYAVVHPDGYDVEYRAGTNTLIDSSCRPPLELPTEPTWGIVRFVDENLVGLTLLACNLPTSHPVVFSNGVGHSVESILDFIPLTDEQVARIEAHA